MSNKNYDHENDKNNFASVMAGVLIGGLAGAAVMILFAPQAGEQTRLQIQEKSIELRDKANGILGDAIEQVRMEGQKIANVGSQKASELLLQGQNLVADQLENVSEAALAAREKSIQLV